MEKINLLHKFGLFHDQWSPKIIGELNGQAVKLAKLQGDFVWHDHSDEDELFYVVKGELTIHFKTTSVHLKVGEMLIVPKGVLHKPEAKQEAWILLFEPISTKHTGDVITDRTVDTCDKL